MSELSVSQLIKIVIGVFVIAAVGVGVYLAFKHNFFNFFDTLAPPEPAQFMLGVMGR